MQADDNENETELEVILLKLLFIIYLYQKRSIIIYFTYLNFSLTPQDMTIQFSMLHLRLKRRVQRLFHKPM